ncbi:MAG: TetR/AcrR family transcriptional regulator [Pseudomonadota bacterium]
MAYKKDSPPDRIMKAGRRLFFAQGFERVSTDALAKEASVSKATLYKYFPNMVEVLKAVTTAEAENFEPEEAVKIDSLEDLRGVLIRFGTDLLRFLNQADIQQFDHLMHEEARAYPDIASEFYHAAYGRTLSVLSGFIRQAADQGFVDHRLSPEEMAEQLVGMWEGIPMVKLKMGVTKKPFPKPEDWSRKCVDTLLRTEGMAG